MLGPRTGRENIHTLVRPRRALAKRGGVLGTSMGAVLPPWVRAPPLWAPTSLLWVLALGTWVPTSLPWVLVLGTTTWVPTLGRGGRGGRGTPKTTRLRPVFARHCWNHFQEVNHYGGWSISAAGPTDTCIRISWPNAG